MIWPHDNVKSTVWHIHQQLYSKHINLLHNWVEEIFIFGHITMQFIHRNFPPEYPGIFHDKNVPQFGHTTYFALLKGCFFLSVIIFARWQNLHHMPWQVYFSYLNIKISLYYNFWQFTSEMIPSFQSPFDFGENIELCYNCGFSCRSAYNKRSASLSSEQKIEVRTLAVLIHKRQHSLPHNDTVRTSYLLWYITN